MAKKVMKAKVKASDEESTGLVPVIKRGALSVDVGPAVIMGFAKTKTDEDMANAMLKEVDAKRYDLLSQLTAGILKAAQNDKSIDLTVAFNKDAKAQGYLNDQLGIALGFKEVQTINPGTDKEQKRVAWSKAVAPYVLSTADEKNTDIGKRKGTVRSNFLHALKKCCQATQALIDNKINAKMDKDAGTLQLSGPAVKQIFGAPTVHLNEKQTVGTGDKAVKLTEKPSFTALAANAAEKRGSSVNRTSGTRGRSKVLSNPTEALRDIAKSFVSVVNTMKDKMTDKQREIIQGVYDQLDAILV